MFLFNVHNIEISYKRLDNKTKQGNLVVTDPLGVRKVLLGIRKVLLGVRKVLLGVRKVLLCIRKILIGARITSRCTFYPNPLLGDIKKLLNIPSDQLYLHFCIWVKMSNMA